MEVLKNVTKFYDENDKYVLDISSTLKYKFNNEIDIGKLEKPKIENLAEIVFVDYYF